MSPATDAEPLCFERLLVEFLHVFFWIGVEFFNAGLTAEFHLLAGVAFCDCVPHRIEFVAAY